MAYRKCGLLGLTPRILHVCWTQAKQRHIFLVTMTNDESFELREGTCFPEKKKKNLLAKLLKHRSEK